MIPNSNWWDHKAHRVTVNKREGSQNCHPGQSGCKGKHNQT